MPHEKFFYAAEAATTESSSSLRARIFEALQRGRPRVGRRLLFTFVLFFRQTLPPRAYDCGRSTEVSALKSHGTFSMLPVEQQEFVVVVLLPMIDAVKR